MNAWMKCLLAGLALGLGLCVYGERGRTSSAGERSTYDEMQRHASAPERDNLRRENASKRTRITNINDELESRILQRERSGTTAAGVFERDGSAFLLVRVPRTLVSALHTSRHGAWSRLCAKGLPEVHWSHHAQIC